MVSLISLSMDMDDQSALSLVNELENAVMRLPDESIDRQSSNSTSRAEYQRLMDSHTKRAAVMEEYRLMVERRRRQCQQQPAQRVEAAEADGIILSESQIVNEAAVSDRKAPKTGAHPAGETSVTSPTASIIATAASVTSSLRSSSFKWKRPRGAFTGSTASSAAKQRAKVNSAPSTPRGGEKSRPQQGRFRGFAAKRVSPSTTPPLSLREPPLKLRHPQDLHLHEPIEPSDVVSPASSLLLSPKEPFAHPTSNIRRCSGKHEEHEPREVNDDDERTEGEKFPTGQVGELTHRFSTPLGPAAPAAPHTPDASTLVIETEEDKQLLKHQAIKKRLSSVSKTRRVSKKVADNNAPLSEEFQRRVLSKEPVAMNDDEELSSMTSVSSRSLEDMTPMLNRFGRHAEEDVSKSRRELKPSGLSVVGRKLTAPRCSADVVEAAPQQGGDDGGRATEPNCIVPPASHDAQALRAAADTLSGRSIAFTAEDKAACIATVAAVLQGILVQTRRVLPCYYCGEGQPLSSYRLHLDFCKIRTEALYARYGLNPLRFMMSVPVLPIPALTATDAEKSAFAKACYRSVKESILPCPGCDISFRIHELPEHKNVCNNNSKSNRIGGDLPLKEKK
ncbi:hypothetical protein TCSYLVIO_004031 [Trypanosoma cruzi]|nr:hypothetical protein TCSYLVIO_004031 [Trypanosoma cruzi]